MAKEVLVTGGTGFTGSHLSDYLINEGYKVKILDNLSEQVHGKSRSRLVYLNPEADLNVDDVRDREAVRSVLQGADVVFHIADNTLHSFQ